MSTKAVAWALEQQVGNPTAKLVLVGLAEHADRGSWVAWPGRATTALYSECDERTVSRHVSRLVDIGLIVELSVDELGPDDRARFEAIPANRRPKLWLLQGGQIVTPRGDSAVRSRGDKSGGQGGQQGGHSSVHQTNRKPSNRTAGFDHASRRDYPDVDATTALLEESRSIEPAAPGVVRDLMARHRRNDRQAAS